MFCLPRGFFDSDFGPTGTCFPSLICPRIVRVCNVLSVLVFTNTKNLRSPFFYISLRRNLFPNQFILGRERSFKELINNFRKYRMLFILP